MEIAEALARMWREVGRSSQESVAKAIGVAPSSLSRWKGGVVPEGKARVKVIAYASALPPERAPSTLDDVLVQARQQTVANVVKLGGISGIARAVLTMMETVTDQQRLVVNSLAPWVDAEADLRETIARADDPLPVTPSAREGARTAARHRKVAGQ